MKYLDEYRDPALAKKLFDDIRRITTRRWAIMEVCGGQTHSIIRNGIDQLLPEQIELIHGPGCPVCVTPLELIDKALAIAARPDVIFCSFGDMLRVPGSSQDLFQRQERGRRRAHRLLAARRGARSPASTPTRQVVFFGIGFETTAPANAMAVLQASGAGPAELLDAGLARPGAAGDRARSCESPGNRVQALPGGRPRLQRDGLLPVPPAGREVPRADRRHRLRAARCAGGHPPHRAPAGGRPGRAWRTPTPARSSVDGNLPAQAVLDEVFEVTDRTWRGIGIIPQSGWRLRERFRAFDAEQRFGVGHIRTAESALCHSGEVLQGLLKPNQCPAFGKECTPRTPLGATMVSQRGRLRGLLSVWALHQRR